MANSISLASVILLTCYLLSISTASPTAPAFVWSNHRSFGSDTQKAVDYRILTPEALINILMGKLGWSSLLCNSDFGEGEKLDALVAFVGKEFYSEDIARDARVDSSPVLKILKEHFMSSRYSLAFPYVSIPTTEGELLNMLLSSMKDSCNPKSRHGKTLILGSCVKGVFDPKSPILAEGIELLDTTADVKDFILERKASRKPGETDIIVTCPVAKDRLEEGEPEENLLVSVMSSLHTSGTSNAILYASVPVGGTHSYGDNGRLLAANATGTSDTTCDDICETIAGVYEGIIVAVTLLIILISGLCCMMGIDTPSRFESSQE